MEILINIVVDESFPMADVMGFLDLPLDASNMVIGSLIIGLAVDDTIHFLHRFRCGEPPRPEISRPNAERRVRRRGVVRGAG